MRLGWTTCLGLVVKVKATDFEGVVKLVHPENYKLLGELRDVSGSPLSWSPDAVTDFLGGWKVIPVKTFRQGYRHNWIVRATDQPTSTKLQHEFGLAVIKHTDMQKVKQNQEIQKWMPASEQKKTGRDAVFPQTWAVAFSAAAPHKAQTARGQKRTTGALGTSQPSKTVNLNTSPDLGDVVKYWPEHQQWFPDKMGDT